MSANKQAAPATGRDDARLREHLANERTLLAWVRLGLSSAGFGFVVARFGLFLRETAGAGAVARGISFPELVGTGLVLLGPLLVILATWRYLQTEREIGARVYTRRYGLIWAVGVASVLIGLSLAGYLLLGS